MFDKSTFVKLMNIATSGLFMYKDKLYRQVDGVTMGSPLGPTLANLCLAHFESKLLANTNILRPTFYLRYVDDIFCIFHDNVSYNQFFEALNQMHSYLKFTFELGPSVLPFLDTFISLPVGANDNVTVNVYRKPTFTGLMLNYTALCPYKWKIGLMQCMLHRAYTVCSSWNIFSNEVDKLKSIFESNGYPDNIFWSTVSKFVNNKFSKCDTAIDADKVETIFCIPYIGKPSVIFGNKVRSLFKGHGIDVRVVFNTCKVKDYFSLKCPTPFPLKAKVVYIFKCLRDANTTYIGKTKRHLVTRVNEHGTTNTAITHHLQFCPECKNEFSINCFAIMDSGRSDYDCKIKEAIHLKKHKPVLNTQLAYNGASIVLEIF